MAQIVTRNGVSWVQGALGPAGIALSESIDTLERRTSGISVDITDSRFSGGTFNGTSNDAAAWQAAVDFLVPTGGTIWKPADCLSAVGTQVNIRSRLPIFIKASDHGSGHNGNDASKVTTATSYGCIKPLNTLGADDAMFNWDYVSGETVFTNTGGGGVYGLRIVDWDGDTARNFNFGTAIKATAAQRFEVADCEFTGLSASAFTTGEGSHMFFNGNNVQHCGRTGKPAMSIASGTNLWCSAWNFFENGYGDHHINNAGGLYSSGGLYFEDSGAVQSPSPIPIGNTGILHVDHGVFAASDASTSVVLTSGDSLMNSIFSGAANPTFAQGSIGHGNSGYLMSGTASGDITSGALTLHAERCLVTTPNLNTLAAGAYWVLTLDNNLIQTTSSVQVSARRGSNSAGHVIAYPVTIGAGQGVFILANLPTITGNGALNGTMILDIVVSN